MSAHGKDAILVLEDGRVFRGRAFGALGETFGEAVFSTGMTGYQETLTDPSYEGQVVVATAPHIGNTGWNDEDDESGRIWVAGYVVRDPSRVPSNWRSRRSLDEELVRQGVVGISAIDTRALTRHLRERGAMRVGISSLGTDVDALLAWGERAAARLGELDGPQDTAAVLAERLAKADEELVDIGEELSRARRLLAEKLEEAVTAELECLEMKGAQLVVSLDRLDEPGPTGLESVALELVSHPGAPALPLGKGASGGELSRIMLALEVVLADASASARPATHTRTLVFDEIDAGVGGRAAREIGRRLARLARHHQVVVVTHLAQVAAWADTHLVVRKETVSDPVTGSETGSEPPAPVLDAALWGPAEEPRENVRKSEPGRTRTQVLVVEGQERERELARMLSGHEDSQAAIRHAAELLREAVVGQSEP